MICHEYECVFVHIPKCAGQSIERIFLDAVGLTWEARAPLLLRPKETSEHGPPRLAHLTADEYVALKYITPQQYARYFTFAIVRNPWDRVVSFYKYFGFHRRATFKQFLTDYFVPKLWNDKYWFVRPQCEFIYGQGGECLVDYVGRFETLAAAIDQVGKQVGLQNASAPRTNKSPLALKPHGRSMGALCSYAIARYLKQQKTMPDDYRAYYDEQSISQVADLYHRDIETFDYAFDPQDREDIVETPLVQ